MLIPGIYKVIPAAYKSVRGDFGEVQPGHVVDDGQFVGSVAAMHVHLFISRVIAVQMFTCSLQNIQQGYLVAGAGQFIAGEFLAGRIPDGKFLNGRSVNGWFLNGRFPDSGVMDGKFVNR